MAANKINTVNAPILSDYTLSNLEAVENKVLGYLKMIRNDFFARYGVDIVSSFESRIKSNDSLIAKLQKDGISLNEESALDNLNDIVGLRIICPNLLDVQIFIDLLKKSTAIKLINEKDYISHPKDSGYRSYHLIVDIPVDLCDGLKVFRAEIQVRTVLMHAWSRFEHDVCYKRDTVDQELQKSLKERSDLLFDFDLNMMSTLMEEYRNKDTEAADYVRKLTGSKI